MTPCKMNKLAQKYTHCLQLSHNNLKLNTKSF